MNRLAGRDGDLGERLRAWPRAVHLGDLFSGAGTFHKVSNAIFRSLLKKFPLDMKDVKALCGIEESNYSNMSYLTV